MTSLYVKTYFKLTIEQYLSSFTLAKQQMHFTIPIFQQLELLY